MSTVVNVNAVNLDLKQLSGYYIKGEEMNKIAQEILIELLIEIVQSADVYSDSKAKLLQRFIEEVNGERI